MNPRVWFTGDPEPTDDGLMVRIADNPDLPSSDRDAVFTKRENDDWKGPWGFGLDWHRLLEVHGPITEVLEPAIQAADIRPVRRDGGSDDSDPRAT